MQCISCGAEIPTSAAHCPECGAVMPYNIVASGALPDDPTAASYSPMKPGQTFAAAPQPSLYRFRR